MDKTIKCPWCGVMTAPKRDFIKNNYGTVVERRCDKCGKIVASYRKGEGNFLPRIRVFPNE